MFCLTFCNPYAYEFTKLSFYVRYSDMITNYIHDPARPSLPPLPRLKVASLAQRTDPLQFDLHQSSMLTAARRLKTAYEEGLRQPQYYYNNGDYQEKGRIKQL
jgi:hypothetical protein